MQQPNSWVYTRVQGYGVSSVSTRAEDVQQIFFDSLPARKEDRNKWLIVVAGTFSVWTEGNARIFWGSERLPEHLANQIVMDVELWTKYCGGRESSGDEDAPLFLFGFCSCLCVVGLGFELVLLSHSSCGHCLLIKKKKK